MSLSTIKYSPMLIIVWQVRCIDASAVHISCIDIPSVVFTLQGLLEYEVPSTSLSMFSLLNNVVVYSFKVNAARKSKVDDNTARMQSIKQLGV